MEANPEQGPGSPNLQSDVTSTKEKVRTVTLAWEEAHVYGLIQDDPTMVYSFRKWAKGIWLMPEPFLLPHSLDSRA